MSSTIPNSGSFSGCLLNATSPEDVLSLTRARSPTSEPARSVAAWLRQLSNITLKLQADGLPWQPNILGLPDFDDELERACVGFLNGEDSKAEREGRQDPLLSSAGFRPLLACSTTDLPQSSSPRKRAGLVPKALNDRSTPTGGLPINEDCAWLALTADAEVSDAITIHIRNDAHVPLAGCPTGGQGDNNLGRRSDLDWAALRAEVRSVRDREGSGNLSAQHRSGVAFPMRERPPSRPEIPPPMSSPPEAFAEARYANTLLANGPVAGVLGVVAGVTGVANVR